MSMRKVISNHNGAFFVTLPIEYCRKHGLTKGAYVMAMERIDGKLELTPVTMTRQDQQVTGAETQPKRCVR